MVLYNLHGYFDFDHLDNYTSLVDLSIKAKLAANVLIKLGNMVF